MKKTLKAAKTTATKKQNIVNQVRANARDVWLAGLGAFAAMQAEGGKVLSTTRTESIKVFNALVNQGKEIEALAKKTAVKQTENVADKTSKTIDKLEQVFQDRVSQTLSRLGVPTAEDVKSLAVRVEYLTENVKALLERNLSEGKRSRTTTRKRAHA